MRIITGIEIQGFRSILSQRIENIGDFSCFIGVNNSGKSNILRALNLFFTDDTDPDAWFDIDRDYYNDPKRKKKKLVSITVDFNLPENFKFRKEIIRLENLFGRKFSIRRTWTNKIDEWTWAVRKDGESFETIQESTFLQFIGLIRFRYIQNRIIPADILKKEAPAFRSAVLNRVRLTRAEETDRLLGELGQAAEDTIYQANEIVTNDVKSIKKILIGRPEAAMLFGLSGFGAKTKTGAMVSDEALGAGSQAYMMFALLKTIDTNYGTTFGWRQCTIWAIEEPESSLHKDLTRKLAMMLRTWAEDNNSKMQIFATTHSEVITTAVNNGYLVELEEDSRTVIKLKNISELTHSCVSLGISGDIDPILCFPTNTVVIVEGPLNCRILEYVSQKTHIANGYKFLCLHELDTTEPGSGVDDIINYLKKWGKLVHNREKNSPVLVVLDSDVSDDKLNKARVHYGHNSEYRVLRMNKNRADTNVSDVVKGIERFYPKELFIQARHDNIVAVNEDQFGLVSIDKDKQTGATKRELEKLFYNGDISWCNYLKNVLIDIVEATSPSPHLPI